MLDRQTYTTNPETGKIHLHNPTLMPEAGGFLWNKRMMIQVNCRGYATAQFMQPEPAKYAHGPTLEAKTFMQPEHPYFTHHPGRFFYLRDNNTHELFSVPFAPVNAPLDTFEFIVGPSSLVWKVAKGSISVELKLTLA
ncbi:MAG: NdvB protein, partial [Kordiimonas sp.]